MRKERWKPIYNENSGYSISDHGRVYSHKTNVIRKPSTDKDGYLRLVLMVNGQRKYEMIHRLVALYFCDKPEGATIVNHKDFNKQNNHFENLEWTTISGNTKHWYENSEEAREQQLRASALGAKATRKVIDVYLHGEFVGRFNGKEETAKAINKDPKTIYNCLRENRSTRDGYTFKYVGTEAELERVGGDADVR